MSAGNPDQKIYVYAVFFFPDLRTLLRSVWLHDPLGVRRIIKSGRARRECLDNRKVGQNTTQKPSKEDRRAHSVSSR